MDPVTALTTTAGKEVTAALKKESSSFLRTVLGEVGKSVGTLYSVKVNRRIYNNLVKITAEAKRRLVENGLTPQEVPLSIIHPALQAAAVEEIPELQTVWANLLANAADPRDSGLVAPSFAVILKELRTREVRFLDALYSHLELIAKRPFALRCVEDMDFRESDLLNVYANAGLSRQPQLTNITVQHGEEHKDDFAADMREFRFTRDLVKRHSVLTEFQVSTPSSSVYATQSTEFEVNVTTMYKFSSLGVCFVRACRKPEANEAGVRT